MLKVKRTAGFVDKDVPFIIYLNNMELGRLNYTESKDFNLKPGTYTIKAVCNNFHSKDLEITLTDGQVLEVACYPAYKDSKLSRWFYEKMLHNEGIYIEITKDIYL